MSDELLRALAARERELEEARNIARWLWGQVYCENLHHEPHQFHNKPPCPVELEILEKHPWLGGDDG